MRAHATETRTDERDEMARHKRDARKEERHRQRRAWRPPPRRPQPKKKPPESKPGPQQPFYGNAREVTDTVVERERVEPARNVAGARRTHKAAASGQRVLTTGCGAQIPCECVIRRQTGPSGERQVTVRAPRLQPADVLARAMVLQAVLNRLRELGLDDSDDDEEGDSGAESGDEGSGGGGPSERDDRGDGGAGSAPVAAR